jgi:hypothetical protein
MLFSADFELLAIINIKMQSLKRENNKDIILKELQKV